MTVFSGIAIPDSWVEIPNAVGKSNNVPIFWAPAEAGLIICLPGKWNPEFVIAASMRWND